jgi:hypothetical protein
MPFIIDIEVVGVNKADIGCTQVTFTSHIIGGKYSDARIKIG